MVQIQPSPRYLSLSLADSPSLGMVMLNDIVMCFCIVPRGSN